MKEIFIHLKTINLKNSQNKKKMKSCNLKTRLRSYNRLEIMNDLPNFFLLKNLEDISELIKLIDANFLVIKLNDDYERKIINYVSSAYENGHDSTIYESDLRNNKANN